VSEPANPVGPIGPGGTMEHLDEMTCLLYAERQLDRARAQAVSAHTQDCAQCRTLLRALERESRLLTRAMLEEDEPLPSRLAEFHERAKKSVGWIWGVVLGLAATGVYALYTGYVEPLQQRLEQAGFGGTSLLSLLVFQGAFWKGWQSMMTLFEVLAMVTVAGFAGVIFRRRLRRGSALALVLAGLCAALALPAPAGATEFHKVEGSYELSKDQTVKGDIFITSGRGRIDGTVDGDLYFFGQSVEIGGHIKGDAIIFAQSTHVSGQIDGNIRSFTNNLTITGTVEKNVLTFNETMNLDSAGKIGGSLTTFAQDIGIDGHIGRDLVCFQNSLTISGAIDGEVQSKGRSMTIASSAQVAGPIHFEGNEPARVASGAKLGSPVQFTQMKRESQYRQGRYYVWRIIWTAAFVLFGLVLFLLLPSFAGEVARAGERVGAPIGLGVLVFFGVPIAAIIACITVVGIPLGVLTFGLWVLGLFTAEIVVGTVVGNWILGKPADTWGLIGRMALGFVLVRILYTPLAQIHVIGFLVGLGIWIWGMGAIALAIYNRVQPAAPQSAMPGPMPPMSLPPNTTVGGIQPA
jgi:cytoskeletal protein CcmA (bactofilin family)